MKFRWLIGLIVFHALMTPANANSAKQGDEAYEAGDFATAFEKFMQAADTGNRDAMFNIGNMYFNGQGVSKSVPTALEWWKKAADAGQTRALVNLGAIYVRGLGIKKNPSLGVSYLQKAAKLGNTNAMYSLGNMHIKGDGVPKSQSKGIEYIERAANLGNKKALAWIERLKENLNKAANQKNGG